VLPDKTNVLQKNTLLIPDNRSIVVQLVENTEAVLTVDMSTVVAPIDRTCASSTLSVTSKKH
jgi:uncharacterized Fe-S cluster-containing radical SAM superfamily protein